MRPFTSFLLCICSNEGKVVNFKIIRSEGSEGASEYYISARRKFSTVRGLLDAYKKTPIRSKKSNNSKIYLLQPIPVDPSLEHTHKQQQQDKGQGSKVTCLCMFGYFNESLISNYRINTLTLQYYSS